MEPNTTGLLEDKEYTVQYKSNTKICPQYQYKIHGSRREKT